MNLLLLVQFFCLLHLKTTNAIVNVTAEVLADGLGKGFFDLFRGNRPKFCPCVCGKSIYPSGSRIDSVYTIPDRSYPWLVLVHIPGVTPSTGTLLNERYVITSASVVRGLTPYDVKVTLGAYNRCVSDVIASNYSIDSINIHPNYDPVSKGNDLALLRLTNIVVTDRWISPICLPKPGANYQAQVVEIVGWGSNTAVDTVSSCRPKRVGLAVLNLRECASFGGDINKLLTPDKSCVGTGGPLSVICSTDAGGPVQSTGEDGYFELVGVLPDVNVCSPTGIGLNVFTRVNVHFDWLFQNTKDSCYCTKI